MPEDAVLVAGHLEETRQWLVGARQWLDVTRANEIAGDADNMLHDINSVKRIDLTVGQPCIRSHLDSCPLGATLPCTRPRRSEVK